MIKRTVEVTDLHMRTDKCEDCVDVYIASEVYARISELASALRRCADAIDATYADTSEARGLMPELFHAGEAAKRLL